MPKKRKKEVRPPITATELNDPANPTKLVAIGEEGHRIGEDHPRAKLTNADVDLVFGLHDAGLGHRRIARKFGCSRELIVKILKGERRCQHAVRFKRAG